MTKFVRSRNLANGRLSSSQLPMGGRQGQKERHQRLRKSRTPKRKKKMMICLRSRRTRTVIGLSRCIPIQKVTLILELVDVGIAVDDVILWLPSACLYTGCIYAQARPQHRTCSIICLSDIIQ